MKRIVTCLLISLFTVSVAIAQQKESPAEKATFKMNMGIITSKMQESKKFYQEVLGFSVAFENEFYLLLQHESGAMISFLLPGHESQQPIFQPAFNGQGLYITLETENVQQWYDLVRAKNIPIEISLRDEPWGDKHFAVKDPNGVGIDIVQYAAPAK